MLNKGLLMIGDQSSRPVYVTLYVYKGLHSDVAKGFVNSAFDKSGAVEYLGFKFDKSDGEALINIMEKYKDD